jgi:hypothetical protein
MLKRGFRTTLHDIAMQLNNAVGYNRPDCFILDDWH